MLIFKRVCNILLVIVMVIMALIAGVLIVPRLMGYESLAVLSGSMSPDIPVGAIVFIEDEEPEDLQVGDIITYLLDGASTRVTHRITQIDSDAKQVITKGDANDEEDAAPVPYDNIVGKMAFSMPLIGYISIYVKTPLGIAFACGIIIILLLLIYLPEVLSSEDEVNDNKENSKEDKVIKQEDSVVNKKIVNNEDKKEINDEMWDKERYKII